jgi:transcriptional regulator with XRE-family HTH domain
MNIIGRKIKDVREKNGLSQENLALELGITQPTYARLEKEDERLSIVRLMQIAKILNSTVSELINEKAQKINTQSNNENAYNADTINTIINADKEHIQTLQEEISFLREQVGGK